MKKRSLILFILCVVFSFCCFGLVACGGPNDNGNNNGGGTQDGGSQDGGSQDGGSQDGGSQNGGGSQDGGNTLLEFAGIVFENVTLDYDGQEHTIVATGIPSYATVNYTNAGPFVNANEYTISITVTADGYKTYNKSAKLIINKINYPSGIVFEDKKVSANGQEHSILVSGSLPMGTEVVYKNNIATEAGVYNATATLKNPNYNDKTLTATLTVTSFLNSAKNVVNALLKRPDAWSFMPNAFTESNFSTTTNPVKNFSNFVSVNSINKKFMGNQMFVLWEGVKDMEAVLDKADAVFTIGETIALAYQAFINDNPDNYKTWTSTVAGFDIKIVLNESESTMLIGNNLLAVELYADSNKNINKARIQLTSGAVLNYEVKEDYLKFNISLTIKGVLVMKQVEFVRNDDAVSGYYHAYTGLKSVAVKTSAVMVFNKDYAIVMSAKRETEDLLIKGYEEVYSAKTGEFVSAEVLENNKLVDFDTYWVNLCDVTDITNVKAIRNNTTISLNNNLHDVYVNNSTKIFKPKKNKVLLVETSRRFDIEMKTVHYVLKTTNGNDVEYSVVEMEIPMLFVQKDNVNTFSSDIVSENKNTFSNTPTLPTVKLSVASANFDSMKTVLDAIKELLTYDELNAQLGTKNAFFK